MTIEIVHTIESLVLPIIVFGAAIAVILYLIKKEEKRQLLNDKRYDELTNKFVDAITKISYDNNKMLKNLSDSIHDVADKFDDKKRDR